MKTPDLNTPASGIVAGTVPPKPPLPKPQPKPRTRKPTTTLKEPAPAKKSGNKAANPGTVKKTVKAKPGTRPKVGEVYAKPKPTTPKPSPWVKVVMATNGVLVSVYIDAADWSIRFRTKQGDTMDIALGETMPSEAMAAIGPKEVQTLLDWRALVSKVSGE